MTVAVAVPRELSQSCDGWKGAEVTTSADRTAV